MDASIQRLEEEIEALSQRANISNDIVAIRHLHHQYGYYFDCCLFEEVVELFADDGEVRFMGGIFKGKDGIRRLYLNRLRMRHTNGYNGPKYGVLLDHLQAQDVITVAADGKSAKARFRCFSQLGRHQLADGETRQFWEGGLYENEYVKENGIWKIKVLDYRGLWFADFHSGWAYTPPHLYSFYDKTIADDPDNPIAPDALIDSPKPVLWPETDVFPFHYPHPVTGKWWEPRKRKAEEST
jgi:hypothetical protein